MLLCIEMAIFAVFHLWAFPWTVYDVHRSNIVAAESAAGFMPDSKTAYQGGRFGERALMDAFNPWDLIKAVGRGFRWAAVGHRRRMDDISYKTPQGTGLEPTRNQFTAFQPLDDNAFGDHDSTAYNPKQQNYYAQDGDEDRLLTNAQSNPASNYPRPMSRHPPRDAALHLHNASDIGTAAPYDPYKRSKSPYQDSSGHLAPNGRPMDYGIITPETSSLGSQDGYNAPSRSQPHSRNVSGESARREMNLTPSSQLPPDQTPLGPPGRKSAEHAEWERYGGRGQGEDERDLGGGHGVGDNRF